MKKIYLILLLSLLACSYGRAQVYVNAATGNDAPGNGNAPSSPYRSIVYAVQNAAAGTTIYINPGQYNELTEIYINKPLSLVRSGAGAVVIDAVARPQSQQFKYMLAVVNTGNVTIDGLTFRNCIGIGSKAIWVLNDNLSTTACRNITIRNCEVSNIGWVSNDLIQLPSGGGVVTNAIKIEGGNALPISGITLARNTVSNCATGYGEAITVTGNVDTFAVDSNLVSGISNIGIDIAGGYDNTTAPATVNQARNGRVTHNTVHHCMSGIRNSAGIYIDGALNVEVSYNRLYENGVGLSLGAEATVTGSTGRHKVYNNLVYNNVISGMLIGTVPANLAHPLLQSTAYNNTFFRNRSGAVVNGITSINGVSLAQAADGFGGEVMLLNTDGLDMQNNILYPSVGKRALVALFGYATSNFRCDYNNYYRDDNWPMVDIGNGVISFNGSTSMGGTYSTIPAFTAATGLETHYIPGNPAFTDPAAFDLRLTGATAVADKGGPYNSQLSGAVDFGGGQRMIGSAIDAGAYELTAPIGIGGQEKSAMETFNVFPNPAGQTINVDLPEATAVRQLDLFDVAGKKIQTFTQPAGDARVVVFPLTGLSQGIYWLRLTSREATGTRKVVIR